ncbi:MAG TPA: branched-chain amino acid ABC transporter permease [Terriglobales bacterium]
MTNIFGVPVTALLGQLVVGLVNGCFYALLSLGLSIIFGMLDIVNFAHGAFYMLGAVATWYALAQFGIGYWWALLLVPLLLATFGALVERGLLRWLYRIDPIYGLLLTFGLALILEGLLRYKYGVSGLPYSIPESFQGAFNLGFMFLPKYRAWVVLASLVISLTTWLVIEKTPLGAYLRAATENPTLVRAFGVNVPAMITITYAVGVGLAGLAGVLAAPATQISPLMGSDLIIVVFAVVVIGGMGSILGSIITGLGLGLIEGLTKVFYPQASSTVVFFIMAVVLLIRPAGLFGKEK